MSDKDDRLIRLKLEKLYFSANSLVTQSMSKLKHSQFPSDPKKMSALLSAITHSTIRPLPTP
ncbi:hypothetical protein CYANOKiyG1_29190 [Okeania sp. KiyG1]|nr:hypothetical protein CYANOKiyG1_29190 [Okeania sp. KiyG1]